MTFRPAEDVPSRVLHDSSSVKGHRSSMVRKVTSRLLGLIVVLIGGAWVQGAPPSRTWMPTLLLLAVMVLGSEPSSPAASR